ncbi:unnamed protein product [Moneuplotes crassus]|uniref:B box-type domain-containing protein n=1 Tax=Euplotes crassus TaxID=5936 RepID=A0AAD2D078_EUPCR|nr:unnamed protein product [Moneuplotes crassus]
MEYLECDIHEKKIEAFCNECKITLCIDCILSDKHKKHSFTSLDKAAEKQKEDIKANISKAQSTRKTLEKMQNRMSKHLRDLSDRLENNTRSIEEIYDLVLSAITKKKEDCIRNMQEAVRKEERIMKEKKTKIDNHLQAIDHLHQMQTKISELTDLEVLKEAKTCENAIKSGTKNVVECTFSLTMLPELKKDIEINNFGKQLKNALKEQESNTSSTHHKSKKQCKKSSKGSKLKNESKTSSTKEIKECDKPSPNLNESNVTEISTPVCISAKAHFFDKPVRPSTGTEERKSRDAENLKREEEVPSNQKPVVSKGQNSRNQKNEKKFEGTKFGSSSFSYQPSKALEKLTALTSGDKKAKDPKNNESNDVNNFNKLLESTQLMQRDRQKRKKQSHTKHFGNETTKEHQDYNGFKVEEIKEESETSLKESRKDKRDDRHARDSERSHRSYLRHTKTSRLRSVNKRDECIQEKIRKETKTKFQTQVIKKNTREGLPPTSGNIINGTTPLNMNQIRRMSPRRACDENIRGAGNKSSEMFKLEGRVRGQNSRRGSKTNRDNFENIDSKFNFTRLQEKRAERKNQKSTQLLSSILSSKHSENIMKEPQFKKWEKLLKKDKESNKDVQKDFLYKSLNRANMKGSLLDYNRDESPEVFKKAEEIKEIPDSPKDVLDCLRTPESQCRAVSIIGGDMTKKSIDFNILLKNNIDSIFTIAGYSDKPIETIENYSCDNAVWIPISCPLKDGRTKFSVVSFLHVSENGFSSDRILIMGGKTSDGKRTDLIQEYNPKTNKLQDFGRLPKPMSGFSALCMVNKIYIIGGNDGKIRNNVECFDLETKEWTQLSPLNQKRDELSAAIGPDNCLYAIGGYGGSDNKCLITAEKYDIKVGKWEIIAKMKDPRRALSAVSLPNGVYALGGYDGEKYLNSVEKYDSDQDQWVSVPSMIQKRCTLSSVSSNDCRYIYAIGGFNGSALETVERYDIVSDKWEQVQSMNSKRFMHASVLIRQ